MKRLLSIAITSLLTFPHASALGLLSVGTSAPGFTLPSQDKTAVSLASYLGKWVVLYFYPKDMTTGCTIEAHNFQRDLEKYEAANAVVLGVSLDTTQSHWAFCIKESLRFHLLADPAHKVVDAYGVPVKTFEHQGMTMSIAARQTFLIDPHGTIVRVWPNVDQDIEGHSAEVLAAIAANKK
jgi:thioredoxin-dependent peroxiredoxin